MEKRSTQSIPWKQTEDVEFRQAPTISKFGSPAVLGFPLDR
jgi:hypothetical protein